MKIAMIGPKLVPSREGGVDVVVERLSKELVAKGNETIIYTRKIKGIRKPFYYEGIKIKPTFTINKKTTGALIYSFFATLKALLSKVDVIHFHAEGNTFFLWMAKFSKKRIIVTIHGLDWKRAKFKGLGSKMLLKSEKRIVKYADEIITLSKKDSDYFLETYNRKTTIIPNGFEYYPLTEPNIIKEKYGLEKDDYILFLARIVPEKGLHYLIEAYNSIDIPQKLVVAGGENQSRDYYEEMKKKASPNNKIIFVGHVEGQFLEELFSNEYIYVLPSDVEGMPMSLLEALGHRKICLVSDIKENLIDERNMYVFEHGDVQSLQRQLIAISKERKLFVDSNLLSWDKVAEQTLDLYMQNL